MSEENVSGDAQASDAPSEETPGGTEHFEISDLPPGAPPAEPEPVAAVEDTSDTEEEAPGPPPERFFTFKTADGEEKSFESSEDAQQFFSSWNGRLSKAERELQDVTHLNLKWQDAYKAGELVGEPDKETPGSKESPNAALDAATATALQPHDWSAVHELIKKGEGKEAIQYVEWRNGVFLKKELEGIRKEIAEQFEQQAAPAKFQSEVSEAITYVAQQGRAAVNDMGEPMFPEFQDGDGYSSSFVKHFRDIWLGQDVNLAADPNGAGFKAAYYEAKSTYKEPVVKEEVKPSELQPTVAVSPQAAAVAAAAAPRNPDGTFAKRNQALAMSESDGSSSGQPSGARPKEDIVSSMRDVGTPRSKHFAVAPD